MFAVRRASLRTGINLEKTGWQGERDGKDRLAGRGGWTKRKATLTDGLVFL